MNCLICTISLLNGSQQARQRYEHAEDIRRGRIRLSQDTVVRHHKRAISTFEDERLGRRFRTLLHQLAGGAGQNIPFARQDWANVKAAYRLFSNPRVSEDAILSGHFRSTRDRFALASGPVLNRGAP